MLDYLCVLLICLTLNLLANLSPERRIAATYQRRSSYTNSRLAGLPRARLPPCWISGKLDATGSVICKNNSHLIHVERKRQVNVSALCSIAKTHTQKKNDNLKMGEGPGRGLPKGVSLTL